MKNIFLTGEINVGKSTILNRALDELDISAAGFRTLPFIKDGQLQGFYIEDLMNPFSNDSDERIPYIGRRLSDKEWRIGTETFEDLGVRILQKSLKSNRRVILMDELGFFENQAQEFQNCVMESLDSNKVVIGVIKEVSTEFLNRIKARDDLEIIEVKVENRKQVYQRFKSRLEEVLECPLNGPTRS